MGYWYNFLNCEVFLSVKVVLILANSVDSDEMQHYATFHLGLHCMSSACSGVSSIKWVIGGIFGICNKYKNLMYLPILIAVSFIDN